MVAGAALAISVLLPWYRTNLGPPFSPDAVTGWEASTLARIALVLGVVITLASIALALDAQGQRVFGGRPTRALGGAVAVAGGVALALVAVRLALPPEPAEFFSRGLGLYLAALAATAAVIAGVADLGRR